MTVALQSPIVSYIGNGVSTIYTYPFYLLEASHMQVYKNGGLQAPTTYTLSSVGNSNGGEVTFSVAPTLGEVIILRRVVPATQLVDYQPFDAFPADTHERALDKLTMLVQDGFLTDTNSVRAPTLEPAGLANLILPAVPQRANFLLGFDPSGNVAMYPQQDQQQPVTTAHGSLTGLSANDHPQYLMVADAFGTYLPKSGGTMTGPLTLMTGFPGGAFDAVPKSYVDAFIGTVITKNITSNAFGDAELTVHQAWNSQATVGGITRASNEIIYYRWPSTGTVIYRYTGQQQGPINWTTVSQDWVAASGVAEAPLDLKTYGRNNAAWVEVLPKTGGVFTGPITASGITSDGPVQINGNGVVTGSWSANTLAVAGNTTIGGTLNCGPITSPQINVSGPVLFADGTINAPAISWINDTDSGFYRSGTDFWYSHSGVNIADFHPTGLYINAAKELHAGGTFRVDGIARLFGQAQFANGTMAAPGIAFTGDPATGILRNSTTGFLEFSVWSGTRVIIAEKAFKALGIPGVAAYGNETHEFNQHIDGGWALRIRNGGGDGDGVMIHHPSQSARGDKVFLYGANLSGEMFAILANGGLKNNQANNINTSDASLKSGIHQAPDYTAFVEGLQYKRFGFIAEPGYETDGVVAQDIEALDPTLVTTGLNDKLGVYEQRLQQRINSVIPKLIERIKALEAKL